MDDKISIENKPARQVDRIIKKFGSQAELARAMKHKNNTTVGHWFKIGYVPTKRIPEVIAAGEILGIKLVPRDFQPVLED